MKMNAQKIFKIVLTATFFMPIVIWIVLGIQGELGAEPIVKINTQSGYIVLILVIVNLWLGVFLALRLSWLKKMKWLIAERRSIGIASGVFVLFHFLTYLGKEAFLPKAWEQIITKKYLTFGISAAFILWLLTLTSNNFSQRKMGGKNWKRLHRFVHFASILIVVHVLLIEKGNIPLLLFIIIPIVPFQLFRFYKQLRGFKQ